MSAKDNTEKVLRDIHVLFSKAEPFEGSAINVVVNKNDVMELLKELNSCMYEMMDEYELTSQSQAKAKREMKKEGDDIIFESTRKAEDIYAASVMYTDNTLNEIQDIMKEAIEKFDVIYEDTKVKVQEEVRNVKRNQSDLKASLSDLIDTQKYLHLIEDENRRIAKQKESGQFNTGADEKVFANVQPEIRVNEDYFRAQGMNPDGTPLSDSLDDEAMASMSDDLDAEYFGWKESEESENTTSEPEGKKKGGFGSFFSKK